GAGSRPPGRSCSTRGARRWASAAAWSSWSSSAAYGALAEHRRVARSALARAASAQAPDTLSRRMMILDRRLDERAQVGDLVNVALVGSGFMGRAVARRLHDARGLRLVAVANRTRSNAEAALAEAGVGDPARADDPDAIDAAAEASRTAITADALAVCRARSVDVV